MSASLSIPAQCRRQAGWCESLGSAFYAHLLLCCADAYEQGGPIRDLLQAHENDSEASALPLRLMGAAHRLVLEERAPELGKFYPSAGGAVKLDEAWEAFNGTIRAQFDSLQSLIENPVQTNEVGRSGGLLGGFGLIAEQTRLPLRLLEIGTSAGLNLRWDRYRYEWPGGSWGDAASSVCLRNIFPDGAPSLPSAINVIDRAGCDPSPVDVNCDSGRLTLLSYTWADQADRIHRLKAAIEIAQGMPCTINKAHGADWLEACLGSLLAGAVTVIFHSVVWQYVSEPEQQRIDAIINEAGNRASPRSPVAWLRMEPGNGLFEIRLRIYPGFEEQVIATSHPHAPSVHWLLR